MAENASEKTTGAKVSARRASVGQRQDRRSLRTRSRLARALMALLRDKPLKSITVKELTDLADVNRATFYAHFSDVFDMAGKMREELKDVFRSLVETHAEELGKGSYRGLLNDVFEYFDKNEEALSVVLGPNSDGTFLTDIIEVMRTAALQALASAPASQWGVNPCLVAPELVNYHFYFIAGGVSSIMKTWVSHGRREPIGTMVDMANTYVESVMACLDANVALFEKDGLAKRPGTSTATALAPVVPPLPVPMPMA